MPTQERTVYYCAACEAIRPSPCRLHPKGYQVAVWYLPHQRRRPYQWTKADQKAMREWMAEGAETV